MLCLHSLLLLLGYSAAAAALHRIEPFECFTVNGADYRGWQNQTSPAEGGHACLYWNQTREHVYNTAKYPNGEWGLGSHNYCRNPDGDVQPWCYVPETEEGIYWKYCDIPSCHMPGYLGCFLDSGNPPTLSGSSGTSRKLTVQVCIRFCRKRGYKFAGVEAGYACFCGHEGDVRRSHTVGAVECDQVCFGKSSELCGGDGRIGIYDVSVGACQGNSSTACGVIYSPDYPDDYGADSNCSWTLRPPACRALELTFRLFDVQDPNDRLQLWDGPTNRLLAQFDGHHRPGAPLLLLTEHLILTFQSDQLLHAQGFAIFYRGVRDPPDEELASSPQTLSGDAGVGVLPTAPDALNSTWAYSADDSSVGVGAWVMYSATGAFVLLILATAFHLRKRTCLFVQKKGGVSGSFCSATPRGRGPCQCLGGEAWAVAYRHTRVVICTGRSTPHRLLPHGAGSTAGDPDEASSECSCLCHSYENLSSTSQTSLKSLISTI